MNIQDFQHVVLRVSDSWYCRHWVHFNYPAVSPWIMAIKVHLGVTSLDVVLADNLDQELSALGFKREDRNHWTIERTWDDRQPGPKDGTQMARIQDS